MPDPLEFKDCDTAAVFAEVSGKLESPETRALWKRVEREFKGKGGDGALSYLKAELQRLGEQLDRELARLNTEQ